MEIFDKAKIKKDLKIDARALGIPSGAAEIFIQEVIKNLKKTLKSKDIITEKDLERFIEKDLKTGFVKLQVFAYDQSHNVISIYVAFEKNLQEAEKALKQVKAFSYYPSGLLKSVLTFNYDATEENDAFALKSDYEYDSCKNLKSESFSFVDKNLKPLSKAIVTKYSVSFSSGKKNVTITNPDGSTYCESYDFNGKLVSFTDECGRRINYTYFPCGEIKTMQSPYGGIYSFTYDSVTGNRSAIYKGSLAIKTFSYDEKGRLVNEKDASSFMHTYSYKDDTSTQSLIQSNACFKKTLVEDSLQRPLALAVQDYTTGKFYKKDISYDDFSMIKKEKVEGGVFYYDYDAWGNIIRDRQKNISYSYDFYGNIKEKKSDSYTKKYFYNCFSKVSRIEKNGRVEKYFYDASGNLLKKSDSLGTVWEGCYDSNSNLIAESGRCLVSKSYQYDKSGLLVKVYESGTLVENRSYSADLRNLFITDAMGNKRLYTFDPYGALIEETNTLGKKQTFSFDEKKSIERYKDFNGCEHEVSFVKNQNKKIIKTPSDTSSISYDAFGSVVTIQSKDDSQTFSYDSNHNLARSSAFGRSADYLHDAEGKLLSYAIGSDKVSYTYDKGGSLLSLKNNSNSIDFTYTAAALEKSSKSSSGLSVQKEYDAADRPIYIVQKDALGACIFAQELIYDANGRLTCLVNKDSSFSLYEYDERGRLLKVYEPYDKKIEESVREEFDSCQAIPAIFADCPLADLPEEYKNQLKKLKAKKQKCWQEQYEYDKNSNMTSRITPLGTLRYTYNSENALLRITGPSSPADGGTFYEYDANGNLISEKSNYVRKTFTYTDNNQLASVKIQDDKKSSCEKLDFLYDALGRRISVSYSDGSCIKSLYKGLSLQKIYEFAEGCESKSASSFRFRNTSGKKNKNECIDRFFVWGNGRLFLQSNKNCSSASKDVSPFYEYCQDFKGSICTVSSSLGKPIFSVSYSAAGQHFIKDFESQEPLDSKTAVSLAFDFAYTGKQYDANLNLYNYGFRDYSPAIGRFTTQDPIRDGKNWYSYCSADPVNFVDLWGLRSVAARFRQREDVGMWIKGDPNDYFSTHACFATSILNQLSEQYTEMTGCILTEKQAAQMVSAAVDKKFIESANAYVNDTYEAANAMWTTLGMPGYFTSPNGLGEFENARHIFALDTNGNGEVNHFVGETEDGEYFDPWTGTYKNAFEKDTSGKFVAVRRLAKDRGIRSLSFKITPGSCFN